MKLSVRSLSFREKGGVVFPVDPQLHKLTVDFTEKELVKPINLGDFRKLLVVCEIGDDNQPVRVVGIAAGLLKIDWPVLRFLSPEAGEALIERMHSYLDDEGARGQEVFIFAGMGIEPETRCPGWKKFLRKVGASKAHRWSVVVE